MSSLGQLFDQAGEYYQQDFSRLPFLTQKRNPSGSALPKYTKLKYTDGMKLKSIVIAVMLILSPIVTIANGQVPVNTSTLIGTWESSLTINREQLRIALTLEIEQGELQAKLISDGLGVFGLPADSIEVNGLRFNAKFSRLDAEVSGWLRLNDKKDQVIRIDGDWFQNAELVPLVLLPVSAANL
ncbi:MAG: hypothetical protein ACJA2Q_001247 [Pseudohongiellaceae bacterium]|jgi:hypothetical protein